MGVSRSFLCSRCQILIIILVVVVANSVIPVSAAAAQQLTRRDIRILLRIQRFLEIPESVQRWTNDTDFCSLPPSPSLRIACSGNRVVQLAIVGNETVSGGNSSLSRETLPGKVAAEALFAAVTKLSTLRTLTLASLGIWGSLPEAIDRLSSLQVLNLTSNRIYGEIPKSIASLGNLTSLVLAQNWINGSVPDLAPLGSLQELDLGSNRLTGEFPSLGEDLVTVVLRNNSMRSNVPQRIINNFLRLQRLDASWNKLVGPIPPSLFALPSIRYLNLAGNHLTGALPGSMNCGHQLRVVDISSNLLTGTLPACMAANGTVNDSWNCLSGGKSRFQHPSWFCATGALAVKPPNLEAQQVQVQGQGQGQPKSLEMGVVLGIVGGCIGAFGLLGMLLLAVLRMELSKKAESNKFDARTVPRTMRSPELGLPPYQVFTLEEIEDVTNNFDPSNLMGEGSHYQQKLYKGWLRNGSQVLVICLELQERHSHQSLVQYTEMISKLRHQNLVCVLGHCIVTHEDPPTSLVFIVLENILSGSLKDHLADCSEREMLNWPQRMAITMGIAKGIQFLHTGIVPGIFGNDLRAEKISLNDHLIPKITSYNIPLPSMVAPESPLSGRAVSSALGFMEELEKTDVFQFGKILVELISGRLVASGAELCGLRRQLASGLTEGQSVLQGATDSSMQGTFAYQSLVTVTEVAIDCLNENPSARPSMEDVIWNLQYANQVQEGWIISGSLSTIA